MITEEQANLRLVEFLNCQNGVNKLPAHIRFYKQLSEVNWRNLEFGMGIQTAVAYTYLEIEEVNQLISMKGISSSLLTIAEPALIFEAGNDKYAVFNNGRVAAFIG